MTRFVLLFTVALGLLAAGPGLEETQWRLKKIADQAEVSGKGQKKPYLKLEAKGHRLVGFSGCNRIMGSYKLKGSELGFEPTAGTKMACEQGMDVEKRMTQALTKVKAWKMAGQGLELLDGGGKVLAMFEAVAEKAK